MPLHEKGISEFRAESRRGLSESRTTRYQTHVGGVAEWSNAPVLKTGVRESVPWVRIPPPPPPVLTRTASSTHDFPNLRPFLPTVYERRTKRHVLSELRVCEAVRKMAQAPFPATIGFRILHLGTCLWLSAVEQVSEPLVISWPSTNSAMPAMSGIVFTGSVVLHVLGKPCMSALKYWHDSFGAFGRVKGSWRESAMRDNLVLRFHEFHFVARFAPPVAS